MSSAVVEPRYSVVVAVHDTGCFVAACARSILDQQPGDVELILVDDGSTDDSWDVCRRLAAGDDRVHAVRQEHAGPSIARNRGLALARGRFVSFVDSDDTIAPGTLAAVDAALTAGPEPDIVIYSMRHVTWSDDGLSTRDLRANDAVYTSGRDFIATMVVGHQLVVYSAANKFYRRAFLVRCGLRFRTDLDFGEDRLFNYAAVRSASRIATSSHVGYQYHIRPRPSLSQRYRPNHIAELLDLHAHKQALVDDLAGDHPERTPYLARDLRHEIKTAILHVRRQWPELSVTERRREVACFATAGYPPHLAEMPSDTAFRRVAHAAVRHRSRLLLYLLIATLARTGWNVP